MRVVVIVLLAVVGLFIVLYMFGLILGLSREKRRLRRRFKMMEERDDK